MNNLKYFCMPVLFGFCSVLWACSSEDEGTWTLTGNSYVSSITLTNGTVINKNGYTLTCSSITNTSGTINE